MSNLLVIDTSSTRCVVALQQAGVITSRMLDSGRHNAQQVLPLLAEVLEEAQAALAQVDAIAVVAGPGSFTGIRIGIGVAQGLSMANNTPVLPLSILAIKAYAALRESVHNQALVSDAAREGEVYFAAYRQHEQSGVELLGAEQVGAPADMLLDPAHAKAGDAWLAVGSGWQDPAALQAAVGVAVVMPPVDPPYESADLLALAQLRLQQGDAVPAEQALPNYVKESLDYSR